MRKPLKLSLAIFACALLFSPARTSQEKPSIPDRDRVRLAEAFRLAEFVRERIWPGWSGAPFPVLLVTREHEFLIRHPQPSEDFKLLGPDELLGSDVYFRKRVFASHLLATFPAVGGVSTIVIGQAENTQANTSTRWVVTLLHEHFHQWQESQPGYYDAVDALGLARGDTTGMWMLNFAFPYESDASAEKFAAASRALRQAINAPAGTFEERLNSYLRERELLRQSLGGDDYKYLAFQLWKEGVARYTEFKVAATAASAGYEPSAAFRSLPDFVPYADDVGATLRSILSEIADPQLAARGRVSFYAFGAAEGLLLDRVSPDWRKTYLDKRFDLAGCFRGRDAVR